ncbi:hypothetical protein BDY19DRAFT_921336 [Irpex rosettiformis]|uniref:Uncharacterized protein n=1 Tax=Irpex rosettiformis TaxID=378272 RepID=A0ACB8UF52_9APHY|nr:hypothetical protein BDY19DRAFT_921336 [Irpex rosettiformis]
MMNYLSSYDYYRSQLPGWGSSQFQFRAPPSPIFQPRSTWNGFDYYRAHAPNPDHNLYYTVMNRTREFGPTGGVGMHEARIWQRRVYGGMANLTQLLPADIGVAAAYEAYRYWKHHNRLLFEPLAGVIEREREALVGLAIAEASALWQLSGRPTDAYGLRDCLESAALTASRIAWQVFDEHSPEYETADYGSSRRHGRRYSTVGVGSSPIIIRADSSTGYSGTPYSNPIGIPGHTGLSTSARYGAGGSAFPAMTTTAMPISGGGGSPYVGAGGLPYGMSAMPGTGTSPYGSAIPNGMPGPEFTSIPVLGGAGVAVGGVGSGAPTGAMYQNTTPPMGMGVGAGVGGVASVPTGAPYSNSAGVNYPGGYQPGTAGSQAAAAYVGNPPSPYIPTGGVGLQNVAATQPVGYATSQPGYGVGGAGPDMQYGQPQTGLPYQQQQMAFSDAGMNGFGGASGGAGGSGTTVVVNGRAIPAPSGSTIAIDTKSHSGRRSRRVSTSGHETKHHHRHRSSSIDPLRREQGMMGYPMVAR